MDSTSPRRLGDINIGHTEVVAPAPQLAVSEQRALGGGAPAALGATGPAVVPPPPSIPGNAGSSPGGRLISLGVHPAAMREPMETPNGNRRGTFAATPAGKTGAAGTPDIATSDPGSGSSAASKNNNGIPSGLMVGAAPNAQSTSTVAGQGNGTGGGTGAPQNSDNSRLIADAAPPRVSATPPRSASEVSEEKATDVDHWIFGDRKFYAMTLNMPNLNSAGGSWVIRFAELNGNESKGELTAPVATQKVDPAYPLEMMRRNVHGTVTLYAVIRNDGSVTDVRVLRGVDDQLDQYARAALSHWRFRPATKNGTAVDLEAVVMIPFRPVRSKSSF
jgi:TonB family protein